MTTPTEHRYATTQPRWFRWLSVIAWLSALGAFLVVVLVVVQSYQLAAGRGMAIATLPATTEGVRDALPVPRGWRIDEIAGGRGIPVAPTDPRPDLAAAYLVTTLPPALVNLAALAMVVRVMDTPALTTDRVLFSESTAHRLRRIGRFVIIASLAVLAYRFVIWGVVQARLMPEGIFADPASVMGVPLTPPAVWFGLALLGLAEVIRRGHRMREDLEGVV